MPVKWWRLVGRQAALLLSVAFPALAVGPLELVVESRLVPSGERVDTLDLYLKSDTAEIGAWQFVVASTNRQLIVDTVLPGELHTECGWDFFDVRRLASEPGEPPSLIQITGLYKSRPDTTRPECVQVADSTLLAKLVVKRSVDAAGEQPIVLWWRSCTDNTIASADGSLLVMTGEVQMTIDPNFPAPRRGFPSHYGPPERCWQRSSRNPPQPLLRVTTGGLRDLPKNN